MDEIETDETDTGEQKLIPGLLCTALVDDVCIPTVTLFFPVSRYRWSSPFSQF